MENIVAYNDAINGLFYEVKGEGEPIIFIHGIGGSHHSFHPQIEVFSRNFKTIAIDLRGHGQSKSAFTLKYMDIHCQSILDLMEHLKIEEATFVGLSYGGIVTQEFATRYSEKVTRMVLIDTYANLIPKSAEDFKLLPLGIFLGLTPFMPKFMVKHLMISKYKKWKLAHDDFKINFKKRQRLAITFQLAGVLGRNYLKTHAELDIPTLVIVGDAIQTVVEKSKEIAEHIPGSEFLIVEDSVDPCNLCNPILVNEFIKRFVSEKRENIQLLDVLS